MTERPTNGRGDQGGVRLVTRERPVEWGIESTRYHRTNVVSCELVTGIIRTPLVDAYLPPSTLEYLPDLEEALKSFKYPIVLGYLNVDLEEARSLRSQRVAKIIVDYGFIDLVRHFCQNRRFRNLKTWSQVRKGTVHRSRCDYIVGPDRRHFELVGIRDMWKFLLYHFTLKSRLLRRPTC